METNNKIPKEIEDILRAPLDAKAISQHPTKTYLSSIKAIYVTERFNKAFGIGGWKTKVEFITAVEGGMIVVKVIFTVPQYDVYYESFGGNDNGGENNKNFDLGDAYKGATTDALTKIGSYMEVGLDVFKGLKGAVTTTSANKLPVDKWLSDSEFEQAKKFKPEDVKKLLHKYNGKEAFSDGKLYSMKKDFRTELTKLKTA